MLLAPLNDIQQVEELAFEAVRPITVEDLGGWLLRHEPGSDVRRKNSVLALTETGTLPIEAKLEQVEAFYRERRLPSRFQISRYSAPTGLAPALSKRGYESESPTWVMTRALSSEPRRTHPRHVVRIADSPGQGWQDVALTAGSSTGSPLVGNARFGYATLKVDGQPASIGLGAVQGRWVGIFNMLTVRSHRCQGLGRLVLEGLQAWGVNLGANRAYLQVEEANAPAQGLYRKLGFERAYRYSYMTRQT